MNCASLLWFFVEINYYLAEDVVFTFQTHFYLPDSNEENIIVDGRRLRTSKVTDYFLNLSMLEECGT